MDFDHGFRLWVVRKIESDRIKISLFNFRTTMARNEEKAQAMLNRWVSMKRQLGARETTQRPSLTKDCDSISEAERWR